MSVIPDFDKCKDGRNTTCLYKDILYECSTALYFVDLSQFLLIFGATVWIVYKLKAFLVWKNYIIIIIFNVLLLAKIIIYSEWKYVKYDG